MKLIIAVVQDEDIEALTTELIDKVGVQNYLQTQMGVASGD